MSQNSRERLGRGNAGLGRGRAGEMLGWEEAVPMQGATRLILAMPVAGQPKCLCVSSAGPRSESVRSLENVRAAPGSVGCG